MTLNDSALLNADASNFGCRHFVEPTQIAVADRLGGGKRRLPPPPPRVGCVRIWLADQVVRFAGWILIEIESQY